MAAITAEGYPRRAAEQRRTLPLELGLTAADWLLRDELVELDTMYALDVRRVRRCGGEDRWRAWR
jgi:hypothetical protein